MALVAGDAGKIWVGTRAELAESGDKGVFEGICALGAVEGGGETEAVGWDDVAAVAYALLAIGADDIAISGLYVEIEPFPTRFPDTGS